MTNTDRYEQIRTGCELADRIDAQLAQLSPKSLPRAWATAEDGVMSIGELVTTIRRFDDRAEIALRQILRTPVGDQNATLVATAALLPAVIHRYRQRPHSISDAITELTLYIAERPTIGPNRNVANALLDDAARRYRTALIRQDQLDSRTETLTDHHAGPSAAVVEDIAIANVQAGNCRARIASLGCNFDFDQLVAAGHQVGLPPAERQRLSRSRRRIRSVLSSELQDVA